MAKKQPILFAYDFENDVSDISKTHVWGAGFWDIHTSVDEYKDFDGECPIRDFINHLKTLPTRSIGEDWNAEYDIPFILYYLDTIGFKQVPMNAKTSKPLSPNAYSVNMNTQGKIYQVSIAFNKNYIILRDGMKQFGSGSVESVGKDLQIPEEYRKLTGTIDYKLPRPLPYTMTDKERLYLKNDVLALGHILLKMEEMGLTKKQTAAGYALDQFKTIFALQDNPDYDETSPLFFRYKEEHYRAFFPVLSKEVDEFCRKSYKGGFCYVHCDQEIKKGKIHVYDVNSMYPAQLLGVTGPDGTKYGGEFPVFEPKYYDNCDDIPKNRLYIIHIKAYFKIKKKHIPFIQLKHCADFMQNEYITNSEGIQDLWLTSVDYELFKKQYNILYEEKIDAYVFNSRNDIFRDYIKKYYNMKKEGKEEGNVSKTALGKICQNSLYGKFGSRGEQPNCHIFFNDKGEMRVRTYEDDLSTMETQYVPVAAFTTAYARKYIVEAAQNNYDILCYTDTDSLHTLDECKGIWIDPLELGAWDCEADDIDVARYIRQKTYVEHHTKENKKKIGKHWDIKACGMPPECKEKLYDMFGDNLIEEFKEGLVMDGKLSKTKVDGGVILKEGTFAIKPSK